MNKKEYQHVHISSAHRLFDLKFGELWQYRDLVWLFTRRSLVVTYKQTILGPLWLLINPLLASLIYMIVFGGIAGLSTDGIPQLLFYLAGTAMWNYFSSCVTTNAGTFTDNANLFGKVFFPRLAMPVSDVLGNLIKFFIQMIPAAALLIWYMVQGTVTPHVSAVVLVPLVLIQLGMLGVGCGIIISSLTTRYRDLRILVTYGVTLWMYATPVVYPLSATSGVIRQMLMINPVTAPMELFRWALLGTGTISLPNITYSVIVTLIIAFVGVVMFNKVERNFMDTV